MIATQATCDCCPATATVEVTFAKGDLAFCTHHYNKHADALAAAGARAQTVGEQS